MSARQVWGSSASNGVNELLLVDGVTAQQTAARSLRHRINISNSSVTVSSCDNHGPKIEILNVAVSHSLGSQRQQATRNGGNCDDDAVWQTEKAGALLQTGVISSDISTGSFWLHKYAEMALSPHLEHSAQLSMAAPAAEGTLLSCSTAAFSTLHFGGSTTNSSANSNDLIARKNGDVVVGGGFALVGLLMKPCTSRAAAVTAAAKVSTHSPLEYATSWQAHAPLQDYTLNSDRSLSQVIISGSQPQQQQHFGGNNNVDDVVQHSAKTLSLFQGALSLLPTNRTTTFHLCGSGISGSSGPSSGQSCSVGEIDAAALRCVSSERPELHGNVTYSESFSIMRSNASQSQSNADFYGAQSAAGVERIPRLLPALPHVSHSNSSIPYDFSKTSAAWAVTGGTGALGCVTSVWMAQHGAIPQILLGRSGRLGEAVPETWMTFNASITIKG